MGWRIRSIRIHIDAWTTPASRVPFYPQEDSKLRATHLSRRRGGNCPNSLEVLYQLINHGSKPQLYLISCLPDVRSSETAEIKASFGQGAEQAIEFSTCIHRSGIFKAASSYITRSEATGSRTIVNFNDLDEMTTDEFAQMAARIPRDDDSVWHFEGRIPATTLTCIGHLRSTHPRAAVSVEVEKAGREGLTELAAAADIVFYSRSWAEVCWHHARFPFILLSVGVVGGAKSTTIFVESWIPGCCQLPRTGDAKICQGSVLHLGLWGGSRLPSLRRTALAVHAGGEHRRRGPNRCGGVRFWN
jgi:hypothetical protein